MLVKTKYRNMKYAKKYDNKRYGGLFKGIKNKNTHMVLKKALSSVEEGGIIFDLPCGTGRFAKLCTSEKLKWIGADISHEMMHVSQSKLNGSSSPLSSASAVMGHIQCDGENIPLISDCVDATITIRVLLQFPRQTRIKILLELARISRRHVIVDYNYSDNIKNMIREFRIKIGISHKRKLRLPISDIKEEIREAGLQVIDVLPVSKFFSDDAIFVCIKKKRKIY